MSGLGSDSPIGGGMARGKTRKGDRAKRVPASPETVISSRLPFVLAVVFLCGLPIPGLFSVFEGASLALMTMLVSMPIWYAAARARNSPFDATATRAINVVMVCAGFLIVWSLLSTFGAAAPLRASRYIATLVAAFAIYFLVRGTVTRSRIILYVDVLAVGLAVTAGISLLAYEVHSLHSIIFKGTDRAAGFFKNPNQYGMAISTTMPAVMALLLAERQRRMLRLACLVLMFLGLVASGSKTNFLLAWASVLAMIFSHSWIFNTGSRRIGMLVLSLAGSLMLAGLGIVAIEVLNPRALLIMSKFFSGDGEVDSLLTRSFLWTYSFDQFLADPIFGQGAGQRIDIFYREADVSHSHNVLLDYMRTLGAPGLLTVAVMISAVAIVCLLSIARALRSSSGAPSARLICLGLSLSCLSYIAANMSSDSMGPSTSPFFWLFAYLSFATRNLMSTLPEIDTGLSRQPARQPAASRFPALVQQAVLENGRASLKELTWLEIGSWLLAIVAVLIVVGSIW